MKTLFMFIGFLLGPLVQIGLGFVTDDLVRNTSLRALIFGALGVCSKCYLLARVRERPASLQSGVASRVPAVPAVLLNAPYMRYLCLRVPLTIFSLVPTNMLPLYVRFVLALEDWNQIEALLLVTALLGGLASIPLTVRLARRLGKARALSYMLAFEGILFVVCACVPYSVYRQHPPISFFLAFFIGLGTTLAFGLPEALLNDIIDFDELRTGERNEGMYTVIETNLQQSVEIAGTVIPLMVLGAMGYVSLGGCSCGCGIDCATVESMPYARWVCPDNVGYSCTGALESKLLFAAEPAAPPCAEQRSEVLWLIALFMMGLPGLLALVGAYFAARQLITPPVHERIRAQLAAPAGTSRVDPFSGKPFDLPANTDESLVLEHWAPSELEHARRGGLPRLQSVVTTRLMGWCVIIAAIGGVMGVTEGSTRENAVTLGCLGLALLFVLIPYDAARLSLLLSPKAAPLAQMAHDAHGAEVLCLGLVTE